MSATKPSPKLSATKTRVQQLRESKKPWDLARKFQLFRYQPIAARGGSSKKDLLEPGVNFFILTLESIGVTTLYSCEGHPETFYIMFQCSLEQADQIERLGYFQVSRLNKRWHMSLCLENFRRKILRRNPSMDPAEIGQRLEKEKARILRMAALAWQAKLLSKPEGK
jgi:hypothetical protein